MRMEKQSLLLMGLYFLIFIKKRSQVILIILLSGLMITVQGGFTFNMSINNMKHEYTMNLTDGYSIEKFDFFNIRFL